MNCRFCNAPLNNVFVDLNSTPPSNSFLKSKEQFKDEKSFPLKIFVCDNCQLVQVDEHKNAKEIFSSDYVYFSSYSQSWLKHCKEYVEMMLDRFKINSETLVAEVASNDGYLLQYFKEANVPVLGIEPTSNTAKVAIEKGIPTVTEFFGVETAKKLKGEGKSPYLMLGNNVLAHVPDINDFVGGFKVLLDPKGVLTMEFPHLLEMIENNQFDTIYHEHFSYLSLFTVDKIFEKAGLKVFDVDQIPTHGGSLRIYVCHSDNSEYKVTERFGQLMVLEKSKGIEGGELYNHFQEATDKIRTDFLHFLSENKTKKIVGYGAAAKGNTLMNYCGVNSEDIDFVVDASPHKQETFLPGSHIPVYSPNKIKEEKPDYVVILPWNLKNEIESDLSYIRDWGGQFVVAIPELRVF